MKARLGDYIREYSVRNKSEEDIPVYSVTNTQGFCQDYFGKEVASKDKSTYKIVPRGYFAYNPSRINVGSVDWQRYEDSVIVSPLYNVFSVTPELDQQYLFYYLKSNFALQRIKAVARGSVRDNLRLEMLYEFPIRIPSISEQKDIAGKLDKVKQILSLREQELSSLDELIKARFVEMFGECRESISAGDLMHNMRNGVSPSTSGKHQEKVFTLSAITQGQFDPNMWKDGIFDAIPAADKRICSTDFYMCRGNGNKSLVGAGVYSADDRDDLVFPDTVIAASVDTTRVCLPYLFVAWMQPGIREQIEAGARTTNGTYKINQHIISKIKVPLPPLPEQQQFATFVAQIDKSKFTEIITTKHSFVINKGGDGNCFGQFSQGYVQPLVLSLHFYHYQQ